MRHLLVLTLVLLACSKRPTPGVLHIPPEGVEETPVAVGGESRMGFATTDDGEHRVVFTVPEGTPTLWLACAVVSRSDRDEAGGAAFSASLASVGGRPEIVFDSSVLPGRWVEAGVDLTLHAGRRVELVLRARHHGPGDDDTPYWATPIVVSGPVDRPNVLLICIDSLRADHLGCYGYRQPTSPTVDSLAAAGCLFTRAIAQASWTLPSHASLFTSLYLKSHGADGVRHALSSTALTLAEVLRRAGYLTVAVVSGGPMRPPYGLHQGFDVYDASCLTSSLTDVRNPCTHHQAGTWLERCGQASFFMFVHYWDVHHDYVPPAPFDTIFDPNYRGTLDGTGVLDCVAGMAPEDLQHLIALYDGEIAHTDRYVSLLLAELRKLALGDRTALIVTSDHGDEFFEHGSTGHGQTVFQELIHVPLMWVPPGGGRPRVVDETVQLVDVAPSILDLLGIDIPQQMEGVSFLPLMRGRLREPRPAFSEARPGGELKAAVMGDRKLIMSMATQHTDAYDLAADPREGRPLPPERWQAGPLQSILTSFTGPHEEAALRIRVAGVAEPGTFVLSIRARGAMGVIGEGLEPGDSVEVSRDGGTVVVLRPEVRPGDMDGLALELSWEGAAVEVNGAFRGRQLGPEHFILGRTEGSEHGAPFKVRADDPRLQGPPESFAAQPTDVPRVYVWAERHVARLSVPAELDKETEEELRALGYLQ